PFLLRASLRPYQKSGMDWLVRLHDQGLSGILADEMGLGKTVQTIALLAHLACAEGIWGPHLIIVPTSVLSNWEREFQRFAPGFHVLSYHGSARERKEKRRGWQKGTEGWAHIVITSYSLAIQDSAILRRRRWYYLILDEGHSIKNARSLRWQTLLTYPSARRLILTGTPLQNNLEELWALLYFLMPPGLLDHGGGFANAREFQEWFSRSSLPVPEDGTENLDSEDGEHAVARLHALLRPYLLRRLKDEVEGEMPGKHEVILWCDLSQRQRRLYDDYMSRAQTREMLLGEGSERPKGSYIGVMNCMMQLRKVCNHPDLFQERGIDTPFAMSSEVQEEGSRVEWLVRRMLHDLKEPVDRPDFAWQLTSFPDRWALQYDCGKLQRLALLLRDLRAGGHRPLIFTQMTRMLDILEAFLNLYGLRYLRLDGSTKVEDRLGRTERFNQDSSIFAFILSTRSGGVGINLTGADTVIFYDSDWNPFMDRQCQDRCHRIGQTREVTIYRLISDHTIEVNILRAAEEKRQLDRVVLEEGDFTTGVWPTGLVEPKHESRDKGKIWEAMAEVEEEEDRVALSKAEAEERAGEREIRWEEGSAFGSGEDIVRMNGERMGEEGEGSVDEYMVRMALWRRMTS
ncbi:MAG: SNF2 family N-terminal domain-containing protein, partial [Piptocephalis tieghemiana]